jgi:hypothetical protein
MDQSTIVVKHVRELPKGFKIISARPGTAAYEYISNEKNILQVGSDPRFLGGLPQPDGALLVFQDGTSVLSADDLEIN